MSILTVVLESPTWTDGRPLGTEDATQRRALKRKGDDVVLFLKNTAPADSCVDLPKSPVGSAIIETAPSDAQPVVVKSSKWLIQVGILVPAPA
jgi:hypothetical protein